jgi:hypothetical protein
MALRRKREGGTGAWATIKRRLGMRRSRRDAGAEIPQEAFPVGRAVVAAEPAPLEVVDVETAPMGNDTRALENDARVISAALRTMRVGTGLVINARSVVRVLAPAMASYGEYVIVDGRKSGQWYNERNGDIGVGKVGVDDGIQHYLTTDRPGERWWQHFAQDLPAIVEEVGRSPRLRSAGLEELARQMRALARDIGR